MAISEASLKKITDAPSAVASMCAAVDALVLDQSIKSEVGGLIKLQFNNHAARLEPAILANLKAKAAATPPPAAGHAVTK